MITYELLAYPEEQIINMKQVTSSITVKHRYGVP
uniref:Uncharacterized protein n=1 Tax=Rhizophora mucronata TaxID=61149 RepID=A0A2P2PAJ2_RHIMU